MTSGGPSVEQPRAEVVDPLHDRGADLAQVGDQDDDQQEWPPR